MASPTPQPKHTEAAAPRRSAGYKSWKKKYRKMRIDFDEKMAEGEDIFRQEAKAQATVKRLAVENDRLLDLLHEINITPQIPPEKRIDITLSPVEGEPTLDIDKESPYPASSKSLRDLLKDVPHLSYAQALESKPALVTDTQKDESGAYPASFLSPDDIDNYLHLIDNKMGEEGLPTMAPVANAEANPPVHPLLRNPNSSTSWLRANAPHIFLDADHADGHGNHDDEGGPKKSRGKGERGGKGAGSRGGRKSTGARAQPVEHLDSQAEDDDVGLTPVPKGKRKRDDDGGYRPKGGSGARPNKKKRKSDVEGTPSEGRKKKVSKEAAEGGD